MDDKLTKSIQEWLEQPAAERDILQGAGLLLRLNRNRILHQNILRRPEKFAAKLEYELKKHLKIRLDRLTLRDVQRMEKEVMARASETLAAGAPLKKDEEPEAEDKAPHIGRREDHEQLPDDIRALYDRNGVVYAKIRLLFDTLKQMEKAEPCDRYEHLKILAALDDEYRGNWHVYDSYVPPVNEEGNKEENAAGSEPSTETAGDVEAQLPTAKEVAAARKFISTGKKKLAAKPDDDDLRKEMQQRIDLIIASDGEFKPDYKTELETLGFTL